VKSRKPELEINLKAKKVTRGDVDIFLTRTELKVLEYLHLNLDKACTVESIAKHVWGDEYKRVDLVTQYIRRLRKKIESNPTEPRYIVTVAGRHGCYLLNL
jgi:two-component system KDP operon response regulator KdpE